MRELLTKSERARLTAIAADDIAEDFRHKASAHATIANGAQADRTGYAVRHRTLARLYRVALRAVKAEARR